MNIFKTAVSVALLSLLSAPMVMADQFFADERYEIHYNAFNSTFVKPDIAAKLQLHRGERRAFVNVSVLEKLADGSKRAVTAIVKGKAVNLIQQEQPMQFRKIDEGNAIYYIGQFGFSDEMIMRIQLQVQTNANKPAYEIEFEQPFYAE